VDVLVNSQSAIDEQLKATHGLRRVGLRPLQCTSNGWLSPAVCHQPKNQVPGARCGIILSIFYPAVCRKTLLVLPLHHILSLVRNRRPCNALQRILFCTEGTSHMWDKNLNIVVTARILLLQRRSTLLFIHVAAGFLSGLVHVIALRNLIRKVKCSIPNISELAAEFCTLTVR